MQVSHILNHTSGLHNALADIFEEDPMIISDFDECLKRIAMVAPETEPGCEQFYHYLSYGWLCGGIIEVPLHTLFTFSLSKELLPYRIQTQDLYASFKKCK